MPGPKLGSEQNLFQPSLFFYCLLKTVKKYYVHMSFPQSCMREFCKIRSVKMKIKID